MSEALELGERCPYLGLKDDPETWFSFASDDNHCHRASPITPVGLSHQSKLCLSGDYANCPVFRQAQGWRGPLPGNVSRHRREPRRSGPSPLLVVGLAVLVMLATVAIFVGLVLFGGSPGGAPLLTTPQSASPDAAAELTILPQESVGASPTMARATTPAPIISSPLAPVPTRTYPSVPTLTPRTTPTPSGTPTRMPMASSTPASTDASAQTPVSGQVHTVQPGENLYRIALRYGTTVDAILRANGLANPNLIYVGQRLTIPGVSAPDSTAATPPATTTHMVQPGENLYRIALRYGTTVGTLAAYNGITNPRQIYVGQVLTIPGPGIVVTPSEAEATLAPDVAVTPIVSSEGVGVRFGELTYGNGGRTAHLDITIANLGITPAIDGGRHYFTPNPDGGQRWVTLLKAAHLEIPVPMLAEPTPLWHAVITLTDGYQFDAFVGCVYVERVTAEGYEPTGPDTGFEWSMLLEDGWFDCGNAYQVKPADLMPGQSATVPLTIYLQHPRLWGTEPPPTHRVQRIELELWRSDGISLGTMAVIDY